MNIGGNFGVWSLSITYITIELDGNIERDYPELDVLAEAVEFIRDLERIGEGIL